MGKGAPKDLQALPDAVKATNSKDVDRTESSSVEDAVLELESAPRPVFEEPMRRSASW
jgi:hypothetical protein